MLCQTTNYQQLILSCEGIERAHFYLLPGEYLYIINTIKRCAHYASFLWHNGQVCLGSERKPAVSQTQDLQIKWPFSQTFPPLTSFSLPQLAQTLFDILLSPNVLKTNRFHCYQRTREKLSSSRRNNGHMVS